MEGSTECKHAQNFVYTVLSKNVDAGLILESILKG